MAEEPTLTEELKQVIKEGEAMIAPKKTPYTPKTVLSVSSIIPIERYSRRDVKRALKADKKRLERESELEYIANLPPENQVKIYNRMKSSDERKLTIKGVLIIIITAIGGMSAMLEVMKALGGM